MRFRSMVVAIAAMITLSGCNEWVANKILMPESTRDRVDLSGDYELAGEKMRYEVQADGRYKVTYYPEGGAATTSYAAFDELRSHMQDGTVYRYYLIEVEDDPSAGNSNGFHYELGYTSKRAGEEAMLQLYNLTCSEATQKIAHQGKAEGTCLFSTYEDVVAAANDALDWLSEARTEVQIRTGFKLEPVAG